MALARQPNCARVKPIRSNRRQQPPSQTKMRSSGAIRRPSEGNGSRSASFRRPPGLSLDENFLSHAVLTAGGGVKQNRSTIEPITGFVLSTCSLVTLLAIELFFVLLICSTEEFGFLVFNGTAKNNMTCNVEIFFCS